jgi:hypothetical protein
MPSIRLGCVFEIGTAVWSGAESGAWPNAQATDNINKVDLMKDKVPLF